MQLGRGPAATSSRGTSTARGCRRRCLRLLLFVYVFVC